MISAKKEKQDARVADVLSLVKTGHSL